MEVIVERSSHMIA